MRVWGGLWVRVEGVGWLEGIGGGGRSGERVGGGHRARLPTPTPPLCAQRRSASPRRAPPSRQADEIRSLCVVCASIPPCDGADRRRSASCVVLPTGRGQPPRGAGAAGRRRRAARPCPPCPGSPAPPPGRAGSPRVPAPPGQRRHRASGQRRSTPIGLPRRLGRSPGPAAPGRRSRGPPKSRCPGCPGRPTIFADFVSGVLLCE